MSDYVLFDAFRLIVRVPKHLDDSACDALRRILESRRFRTDLRRAVRQFVRQYPALDPVRVHISF
jgi:hypothetical protein